MEVEAMMYFAVGIKVMMGNTVVFNLLYTHQQRPAQERMVAREGST